MAKTTTVDYLIKNIDGQCVAIHRRTDRRDGSKSFTWLSPDGTTGLKGVPTAELPLYGTETLKNLPDGTIVVFGEGERATDALVAKGLVAVGSVTGAKATPSAETLSVLSRFKVILWPDNDSDGYQHMDNIALRLTAIGHKAVSYLRWEQAPQKGDAADFPGDGKALQMLLDTAVLYQPSDTVDLCEVLTEIANLIRRYVWLEGNQLIAIVLWVAHTWAFEAAEATPYLAITSAEKQSGKTRLLEVLKCLVKTAWFTGRATTAVLIRKIERDKPTLLLDETDAAFHSDREYAETLRGILNEGYRRGGVSSLCVKQGGDFDLRDFSVFCPKAIAGIGQLPDTVEDRSIPVIMKRRAPGEEVKRFRQRDADAEAAPLRQRLELWAAQAMQRLAEMRTEAPHELGDRAADVWEPLLAIAELAGNEWAGLARTCAVRLSGRGNKEDNSNGVRLLDDVRLIFRETESQRMFSDDLVQALLRREESPWGDLRGKVMDQRMLATLFKPFEVKPHQVRIEDRTRKGYETADFHDAWSRYLPHAVENETGETTETFGDDDEDEDAARVSHVSDVSDFSVMARAELHRDVRLLSARLGGPKLSYAPGRAVGAGAQAWDTFLKYPGRTSEELAAVLTALVTMEPTQRHEQRITSRSLP